MVLKNTVVIENVSILKMGYTPYILKKGFKTMYHTLGGKFQVGECLCLN
jgi:hypothetical protein